MNSNTDIGSGYASLAYARSMAEFGEPVHLPASGGYLLRRPVSGTPFYDAMGCYPLFFCRDWDALAEDLDALPKNLVSVSLVADPFGPYSTDRMERCFDIMRAYKQHYVVDLTIPPDKLGSRHHRKTARAASRHIDVEVCKDPPGLLDTWCSLYRSLTDRHGMRGIRAFSRKAFQQQLAMPEMVVLVAYHHEEIIGAQLYLRQHNVVYCHLGAVSEKGYELGAFYAMDLYSFSFFSPNASILDLGGGAGWRVAAHDGLSRYKQGWATGTQPVFFCGRIINPGHYETLNAMHKPAQSGFFPVYRAGEFD